MKLLNEFTETEVLVEETNGKRNHTIKGYFIHCNEQNRNGRIYVKEHMMPEVSRYKRDYIDTKRALGELSHPEGPQINPDKVSHLITKLDFDDHRCYGEAKILDTPNGNIVKSFIDAGVNFGVSTRGLGSIKESNGINFVSFGAFFALDQKSALKCSSKSLYPTKRTCQDRCQRRNYESHSRRPLHQSS